MILNKNKIQTGEDQDRQRMLKLGGEIPEHIAIIMDGNGRWAKSKGKVRVTGHWEGVVSVRDITEACAELGVKHLTLYTFSTENWYRPVSEVTALMELLIRTLRKERKTFFDNDIRLNAIGDLQKLPPACLKELNDTMQETAHHKRMTLNLALSYSGRWDLVQAVHKLAQEVSTGNRTPDEITEKTISEALSTNGIPDPDLLIRTGGEYRVSNFLLWQIAYSEMYITDTFWPSFRRQNLYEAISHYQNRERRFGRLLEE